MAKPGSTKLPSTLQHNQIHWRRLFHRSTIYHPRVGWKTPRKHPDLLTRSLTLWPLSQLQVASQSQVKYSSKPIFVIITKPKTDNDLISRALTHSNAAALPSFRGPWHLDPRVTCRLKLILSHWLNIMWGLPGEYKVKSCI